MMRRKLMPVGSVKRGWENREDDGVLRLDEECQEGLELVYESIE
jgi:hypothetical protein